MLTAIRTYVPDALVKRFPGIRRYHLTYQTYLNSSSYPSYPNDFRISDISISYIVSEIDPRNFIFKFFYFVNLPILLQIGIVVMCFYDV